MPTTAVDTYSLTQEQLDFRDTIRQIVRERVAPRAAEIDAKAEYPWDIRRLFAEQDLLGLPFDEEYGGTGTGTLMLNVAVEEIARGCASSALILMIQELGTLPIQLFGSEELKQRFLPRCASGEWTPAFALSEPEAGSDPGGMITAAVRDGDEWVINGTKNWITNLGVADFYVVFAKTDRAAARSRGISAFVVEADRPGFSVGKLEHKLGIKGSPTGQPIFDDVRIPAANLIGEEGKGFRYILDGMNAERILIAAECIGDGRFFIDRASAYAKEREVFGRLIGRNQGVQFPIARAHVQLEAAAGMVERAAGLYDGGKPCGTEANMAKMLASEASWFAADMCIQTHGGFGFAEEYDIERKFRETRLYSIAPISNNLVQAYVGQHVLGMPRSY
jgi:alkylation response protein AidB-like acyl-CoA dehydrogenase